MNILIKTAWHLGLIHVPELDNVGSPWIERKQAEAQKAKKDRPNTITKNLGYAAPGETQKTIQLLVNQVDETEWNFSRWDGQDTQYDFREWSIFDDQICDEKGYTDRTRNNYIAVRPDVLAGMTNAQIAKKHGYTERWAEEYAGAVRKMCHNRRKAEQTPLPPQK